jgi:hypothetical protein
MNKKIKKTTDAPAEKLVGCDGYVRLGGAHIKKYIESFHSNIGDNGRIILTLIGAAVLRRWCLTIK